MDVFFNIDLNNFLDVSWLGLSNKTFSFWLTIFSISDVGAQINNITCLYYIHSSCYF